MVFLLYARTVHEGLYLDDQHHVRPWSLGEVFGTFHGPFDPLGIEPVYFRPLVVVTFALDWAAWGWDPIGYHITNVALHAVAVVMVLVLLRRLGLSIWTSAAGALLFGAIPANVATAVYISERSDAMVAIFTILGALCAVRYSAAPPSDVADPAQPLLRARNRHQGGRYRHDPLRCRDLVVPPTTDASASQ